MYVRHQSLVLAWPTPSQIQNPKTLVLGSFNPYNPDGLLLDYHYGRSSNHFWKSIARNINEDEGFFFNQNGFENKLNIMKNRFCCADVIDEIGLECANQAMLSDYIKNNIYSNFLDQTIWLSKTKSKRIFLKRRYNNSIIDFLNSTKSIKKVIHTMGNNRITNIERIKPKEKNIFPIGFGSYMGEIIKLCEAKGIEFTFNSLSPSAYAVKNGKTKVQDLDIWLKKSLLL